MNGDNGHHFVHYITIFYYYYTDTLMYEITFKLFTDNISCYPLQPNRFAQTQSDCLIREQISELNYSSQQKLSHTGLK